jgi:hypothetical protein
VDQLGQVPSDVGEFGSAQPRQLGAVGLGHQGWRSLQRFAVGLCDALAEGGDHAMALEEGPGIDRTSRPSQRSPSGSVRLGEPVPPSHSNFIVCGRWS